MAHLSHINICHIHCSSMDTWKKPDPNDKSHKISEHNSYMPRHTITTRNPVFPRCSIEIVNCRVFYMLHFTYFFHSFDFYCKVATLPTLSTGGACTTYNTSTSQTIKTKKWHTAIGCKRFDVLLQVDTHYCCQYHSMFLA